MLLNTPALINTCFFCKCLRNGASGEQRPPKHSILIQSSNGKMQRPKPMESPKPRFERRAGYGLRATGYGLRATGAPRSGAGAGVDMLRGAGDYLT